VPIQGDVDKHKLYQTKLLVPIYSLLGKVFVNGVTVYGDKEKNFFKEVFFTNARIVNKWVLKSGMYEKIFIKGGFLSIFFKTEKGKEGVKELFRSFSGAPSEVLDSLEADLKESLKNLPKNFIVPLSGIPSSSLKENQKLIAKIISGERLFGIEKEDDSKGEELLNKIKVAGYYGIMSIKNEMEKEGVIFEKNREKANEISR
jgi:hypothetical protein